MKARGIDAGLTPPQKARTLKSCGCDSITGDVRTFIGAACKTLIDSERRKNTQASSDVGARQLERF